MRESKGIFNKKYHEIATAVRSFSVIHGASEHIHFSLAEGLKSTADYCDFEVISIVIEYKERDKKHQGLGKQSKALVDHIKLQEYCRKGSKNSHLSRLSGATNNEASTMKPID